MRITLFYSISVAYAFSFDYHRSLSPRSSNLTSIKNNNTWIVGHDWLPSALVANSSRSPCPLLNTFSNHGFLPRNGRNITKDQFTDAQVKALHFSYELANKTTNAMVTKLGTPINNSKTFDLEDFASHNHTEHDASLTRLDVIQGTVIDVNPGLVVKLLDDSSTEYLNTSSIGYSRVRRENESVSIGSPKLSSDFVSFAQLEASFILLVFGSQGAGNVSLTEAPKEQVRTWLFEERFPVERNYTRSAVELTLDMQQAIIKDISRYHDRYKK
ncbi:Cloroperoxidase [Microthyrium microscopicum]|uniref:Cloroperoxidase n=1 Tax=Microthyrium microscopicum TaxID=703497 RepID=A0A6A6UAL6_9PEZI|nr:Cloroperoxidase [Microthyrium microscopicum]